jgi:lysophospholipase L1-like esterase
MRKASHFRRIIHKSAVLALSAAVTVLVIDLAVFYLLDIKRPGYRPERFFEPDPLTGHRYRPNSEGWWYRYDDGTKFYVRINGHGFADSPRQIAKSRPRIALLGDSTTAFWETEEANRGQYVLEDLLDKRFEVLNFGVRGFGTDQTCLHFERAGLRFSPDIVIYTFCINDIRDNLSREAKPYFVPDAGRPGGLVLKGQPVRTGEASEGKKNLLLRRMHGHVMDRSFILRRSAAWGRRLLHGGKVPLADHIELRPYRKQYGEEDALGLEITTRLIARLDRTARSEGMKFLLVEGLYRPAVEKSLQDEIVQAYGAVFDFDRVTDALARFCRRSDIAFLSLPAAARSGNAPVSALMHPEDFIHLNGEGIRFFSRAVAGKLKSLGWTDALID